MRPARFAVASFAVFGVLACGSAQEPVAGPPDVLLVVLDTVRADHLSSYGYERNTSPRLDALARAGVLFEDVTAPAPWTWPSHASIFTGKPPWVHGARLVPDAAAAEAEPLARFGMAVGRLRDDLPTLAERFAEHGYRTGAIVVNDWLDPELGLLRGFESTQHVDRDAAIFEPARRSIGSDDERPLFLFVNVMTAHSPFRDGPGDWALADRDFLDPRTAPAWVRPYLATGAPPGVHLSEAAEPGEPNGVVRYAAGDLEIPQGDMQKLRRLYDASVRGADYVLERLVDSWLEAGREGVIAVTSDHGEAFGEHGMLDHRASVYSEVLHVPLVLAAPGRLPEGLRVRTPVALQSLHDTLLELADIGAGADSLLTHVRGDAPSVPVAAAAGRDPVWTAHAGGRFEADWRLFRRDDQALVYAPGADAAELYDLAADPQMQHDLAASQPDRIAALRAEADAHFAESTAATRAVVIPQPVAERLRSLGYAAEN
jgi:choline-sulfatase